MSLVYIIHHNENIYEIENVEKADKRVGVRYVSKYHNKDDPAKVKEPINMLELEDGKKLLNHSKIYKHKTMGCAAMPQNPPSEYLRKNRGVRWQRTKDHVCPKGQMPPLPRFERPSKTEDVKPKEVKQEEQPEQNANCPHKQNLKGHKHRINYVELNINNAKAQQIKKFPPRYIDTPNGTSHNLLNTGLVPQYICHRNFGKVPCYLRFLNKKLAEYRVKCQQQQVQLKAQCTDVGLNQGVGVRQMTPEERNDILTGLKTNFAETMKTYMKLSLYTDTVAKGLRKGKLEKDLRQLEQDIFLIESSPTILISEF